MARIWFPWLCALPLIAMTVGPLPADDKGSETANEAAQSVEQADATTADATVADVKTDAATDDTARTDDASTDDAAKAESDTTAADGADAAESDADESDAVPAGHSAHGEVFNKGPRQEAYLMGGTGKIDFPITTEVPLAHRFFEQGVGQLHGFWYFEAERSFRQAATLDPECAMAYWGMAMANIDNVKRARGFIAEAVARKSGVTPREVRYIDAVEAFVREGSEEKKVRSLAFTKALEHILYEFPDDLEAKAFLTLQLYNNKSAGVPVSSYLAVDALFAEILAENPRHPVHHYRIHWWDNERPAKALASAALSGQSAPGIAHMWHMPGHIYSKLKRYEDAVWQQEASARVDHAHMIRDRVLPDRIHNFAHNNEWLIRNLSHVGRVRDAVDLAKNMIEMPRHPDYNTLAKRGSTHFGRLRLFEVLSRYELHDELIALCGTSYLEPTEKESEQLKRLRLLGTAYYETGDTANGDIQLADLRERLESLTKSQDEAAEKAGAKAVEEGKDEKEIEKARSGARQTLNTRVKRVQSAIHELEGRKAIANGDPAAGLELLTKVGDLDKLQLARARFLAHEVETALEAVRAEVAAKENEVHPQAILVDLLWQSGRKDEAIEAFGRLRETSRSIDIASPVFARLAPVAREMGLPDDWRLDRPQPTDVGERPSLESLGPFRWHPSPAPEWTLKDAEGRDHTLKQFRGKPFVLIFYLGHGCLHCAEQLQAFGPMAKDFEQLGMPLVAISTDDHDGLKQSVENYEGGPMPIQLLTNSDLDVFKKYRCHDDFEQQPLHGTFLVDAEGLVRWQDISYEPSMDPKFVLQEAARLLAQSRPAPTSAETTDPGPPADATDSTDSTDASVGAGTAIVGNTTDSKNPGETIQPDDDGE